MMVPMEPRDRTDAPRLLGTDFPDDDGAADPALRALLAAAATGTVPATEALLRLQDARLLVPVVAVLGEQETGEDGLRRDKSSDMAAVLVTGSRGGRALLAFTGTDSLHRWDQAARPVPVAAAVAASAAVQEQAAALVVDIAGPAPLTVRGRDLQALAAGWRLLRIDGAVSWVRAAEPRGAAPDRPAPPTPESHPPAPHPSVPDPSAPDPSAADPSAPDPPAPDSQAPE